MFSVKFLTDLAVEAGFIVKPDSEKRFLQYSDALGYGGTGTGNVAFRVVGEDKEAMNDEHGDAFIYLDIKDVQGNFTAYMGADLNTEIELSLHRYLGNSVSKQPSKFYVTLSELTQAMDEIIERKKAYAAKPKKDPWSNNKPYV